MLVFRNFLYLDASMLGDYLATIEGHTSGDSVDRTETKAKGKSGKAGAKLVEGQVSSGSTVETKQTLSIPDASRFQHFYSILSDKDLIRAIDLFDEEYWESIRKGDILEIEGDIHIPQIFSMFQVVDQFSPLIELMERFGGQPLSDASSREAFNGISGLSKAFEGKPIPLAFSPISTPGYSFGCNLSRQHLRSPLEDLEGEATVFGKVVRTIPRGIRHPLFSLLPTLLKNLPSIPSQQKAQMENELGDKGLAEVLVGPALLVSPLAIYR